MAPAIDYHAAPLESDTELLERLERWAEAIFDEPLPITALELDRIAVWVNTQIGYQDREAEEIRANILDGHMKLFDRPVRLIEDEKVSNRRSAGPAGGVRQIE